jgi:hypothetical protein
MYALWVMNQELTWTAFLLSMAVFMVLSNISRVFVPFKFVYPNKMERYVNLNCTHECWKDIKIDFFHKTDHEAWYKGFWMLVFVWNGGNFIGFCLYKGISTLVLE